jgi:HlyD family secretion protein
MKPQIAHVTMRAVEREQTLPPPVALPPLADDIDLATHARRRRWIWRGLLLIGLAAVVVTLRLTVFAPVPVPITIFRVAPGRVEETVTNSKAGSIKTRRHASLSTEIGGRVRAVPVKVGAHVRRGDLLVQLVDDDLRAQLEFQRRSLDAALADERQARATTEQAGRELTRTRTLVEGGAAAPAALERAETDARMALAAMDATRARIAQAGAAVHVAEVALGRTRLRAPFDAIVSELRTEVGEWITPAPPGIPVPTVVELLAPAPVYVSAPMDEVDVTKMRLALPVRVTLDAIAGRAFPARVTRIAPYVSDRVEQGRTFDVEVELTGAAPDLVFVPGTSADIEVILHAREDVLRVPTSALIQDRAVLVVRDDRLVETPVQVGLRNWDFVEITGGLARGDRVVVSLDRTEVRQGARVRVETEVAR